MELRYYVATVGEAGREGLARGWVFHRLVAVVGSGSVFQLMGSVPTTTLAPARVSAALRDPTTHRFGNFARPGDL